MSNSSKKMGLFAFLATASVMLALVGCNPNRSQAPGTGDTTMSGQPGMTPEASPTSAPGTTGGGMGSGSGSGS